MRAASKIYSFFRLTAPIAALSVVMLMAGCGGSSSSGSFGGGGTGGGNNGGGGNGGGGNGGGNTGPGILPQDKIFYSVLDQETGNTEIWFADPTTEANGGKRTKFVTLPFADQGPSYSAFVPHPTIQNTYFFAYQAGPSQPVGIYKNSTVSIENATQIVDRTYSSVSQMMLSPDGTVLAYVASVGSERRKLYKVNAAGTAAPVALDEADQAAVSPTGDLIVYSKPNPLFGDLFARTLVAEGEPKQLTATADVDETYPAFRRDGQRVVYSAGPTFVKSDLWTMKAADGSDVKRVTDTPNLLESGASYNTDGTKIAFAAYTSGEMEKSGLYMVDASGNTPVQLVSSGTIGYDVYWTSDNGRGLGAYSGFRLNLTPRVERKKQ